MGDDEVYVPPKKRGRPRKPPADATPVVEEQVDKTYVNVTKVNVFTQHGRCPPGAHVVLSDEDAARYKGRLACLM